jgi:hypothetical protein
LTPFEEEEVSSAWLEWSGINPSTQSIGPGLVIRCCTRRHAGLKHIHLASTVAVRLFCSLQVARTSKCLGTRVGGLLKSHSLLTAYSEMK